MILSLLFCLICFVTVVAVVGASPIGSLALGKEGTATWGANVSTWNAINNVFGGFSIYLVIVIVVSCCLLIGICWVISKSSLGQVQTDVQS